MASTPSAEDLAFGAVYEQLAADLYLESIWPGAVALKRSEKSHLDFGVEVDGVLKMLLEVKVRRVSSDTYETTAVHWLKYISARQLKKALGVPTACLVVFTDQAGVFWLDERPNGKEFIAREDRNGEGADHALYNHSRIEWIEGLREAIDEKITTE